MTGILHFIGSHSNSNGPDPSLKDLYHSIISNVSRYCFKVCLKEMNILEYNDKKMDLRSKSVLSKYDPL